MASCQLVTCPQLTLGCDDNFNYLFNARAELVTFGLLEALDIDYCTAHSCRNSAACVLHILGLVTEKCAEKLKLRCGIVLCLRCNLAHQNIVGLDLGTDADNSFLVQILQFLLAYIRDIPGKPVGSGFILPDLCLELAQVDGCEDIFLDNPLGDKDGVLIVISVPWDKAYQNVTSESQLAIVCGRAVCNDFAFFYLLVQSNNRLLGEAGVLVCPLVLLKPVRINSLRIFIRNNINAVG